jgi:hypothetical protein
MKLNITKQYNKGFVEDTCNLATAMLSMKSTHLFIASNAWESVYIELDDSIPEGYLKCLHVVTKNVKVKLPESVTENTLRQLTELYPEKSGALRRTYMQKRSFTEVLPECLVK